MERQLPPFRVTPEEWTKVSYRADLGRILVYWGVVGLVAGTVLALVSNSLLSGGGTALIVWVFGPWGHYFNTLSRLRREKGLPWEEQRVTFDDQEYRTVYESSFTAKVPWSKFKYARQFPEGLLLRMEGKGQAFIPSAALDEPSAEEILRHVPGR